MMKSLVRRGGNLRGAAGVVQKLEVLRTSLRFAAHEERADFQRLLRQCDEVRDEARRQSRGLVGSEPKLEPLRPAPAQNESAESTLRAALEDESFVFEGILGDSKALLECMSIAFRAAPTDLPVLIQGESGTGKELVARVVHANGERSDKPFVSVNCGAIPADLLESELFGHTKGAFSGATSDRSGKFEAADNGTIFLDEVGELPLQGQVKLLRALQAKEIQRVGSDEAIEVDTRVVAATNRDLFEMVQRGEFREDLYYRLGVIELTLPALRDRRDEIPVLLDHFIGQAAEKLNRAAIQMTPRLNAFLLGYDYPGNIRELQNIVHRIACLADGVADLNHLPARLRAGASDPTFGELPDANSTNSLVDVKKAASDAAERAYLRSHLATANGNVTALAKALGLNRTHLQTLLKKHGLRSKEFKPSGKGLAPGRPG